jgi:hypothetical protein
MLGDDPPVLADYDAIRIGMNFDRTPDRTGCHGVLIVVEAYRLRSCAAPRAAMPPRRRYA